MQHSEMEIELQSKSALKVLCWLLNKALYRGLNTLNGL